MNDTRRHSRWAFWHKTLATFVCVAFATASPVPVVAQQGGGQEDGQQADGEASEDGESEGQQQDQKPEGPTPTVSLLPAQSAGDGISSIVPERIGEMLRERVGSDASVDLLESFKQTQQDSGGTVNAAISKAQKLYTSGIGLLEAGQYEKATDKFQKSVDLMKSNMAHLKNFDVFADALSNLARAYYEAGYDFDARKRIREFAHLRPDAKLDPTKYAKELRDLFDKEVGKVKKAGTSTIVVHANVEGATVRIDGENKAATPAEIKGIGFGYHYMVVKSEAGGVWAQQIQVRGRGKKQTYDIQLGSGGAKAQHDSGGDPEGLPAFYTGLQADIADGQFGTRLQPYLEELAKRTGAGYVAWVVMIKKEGEYVAAPFAWRAEDGLFVQGQQVAFNLELSNLMVGVDELSKGVVSLIREMPEQKAFRQVTLVEPKDEDPKAVAGTKEGEDDGRAGAVATGETRDGDEGKGKQVEPIEETDEDDEDDDDRTLMFVGIGSAAVVAAGLVTGGILLFGGSKSRPGGFNANVSW